MIGYQFKRRILALFVAVLFTVGMVFPMGAFAASEASLKVEGIPAGAPYTLYRIGDISNNNYTLSGDFANYANDVSLKDLDSEGWKSAAEILSSYALRDAVATVDMGNIGEDGTLVFGGLSQGLYMVVADRYKSGNYNYTFTPTIVAVFSGENTVEPKFKRKGGGGGGGPTYSSLRATKVWSDGNSQSRPTTVTVQLLRDGKLYEEQELNADNGWSYRWEGLISLYEWKIVEKSVPSGYSVSVSQEGNNYIITNTKDDTPPDDPGIPDKPDDPTPPPDGPNTPDNPSETPGKPTTPTTPSTPGNSIVKLPQTGSLWWPVPILGICGLLMITLGVVGRRNETDA